jgi:lysophospholipase L1-like esterase/RimJ/RimL family protein N-acetyltransferase
MELVTQRLLLVPISLKFAKDVFNNFNDEVTRYMMPKPADDISETEVWIKSSIKKYENKEEIVFAALLKDSHEFIGCMGLHHMDSDTPELGLWTKMSAHGHGYGIEGMKSIVEYAQTHLNIKYLIYPVDRKNFASRNIPETLGGIVKKAYKQINQSGIELDTIEYWIYSEDQIDTPYPIMLFQGDSVTDCNRNRRSLYDLGNGYVKKLLGMANNILLVNRGISGNRTNDLLARWKEDTILVAPDFISILIGINEVWHHYKFGNVLTPQQYKENYIKLLEEVKKKLPETKILLIEPFAYPIGEYEPIWQNDLDEEIQIVRELAKTYADYFIPMQDILNDYKKNYAMESILADGVHPTDFGHQLIAKEVVKVIKEFLIDYQLKHSKFDIS